MSPVCLSRHSPPCSTPRTRPTVREPLGARGWGNRTLRQAHYEVGIAAKEKQACDTCIKAKRKKVQAGGKGRFYEGSFPRACQGLKGACNGFSHRATLAVLARHSLHYVSPITQKSTLRLTHAKSTYSTFMESTYRPKHHQQSTECSRQCGPFALYMSAMHNAGTQNRPLLRKQD